MQEEAFVPEEYGHCQATEDHCTPDAQTTVGDFEGVDGVTGIAEVLLVVGNDVINASTDDSGRNCHDRCIKDDFRVSTAGGVALSRQPNGNNNASDDAHRIGPNRNGTQVPHTLRW